MLTHTQRFKVMILHGIDQSHKSSVIYFPSLYLLIVCLRCKNIEVNDSMKSIKGTEIFTLIAVLFLTLTLPDLLHFP